MSDSTSDRSVYRRRDRPVDRSADADDDGPHRQHASADVAPELFEAGPRER